ncbi:MAG: KEOPS complex subunit Cgi121 [Candidatus Bathyarchaeia archaeon]
MIKHLEEFGKYIAIAGFKDVQIVDANLFLKEARGLIGENVEVQFFNAKHVASWQHLYFAALNALKAFENKKNISKSLVLEVLLYASAQRQIRKATEFLGIRENTKEIAVLAIVESADQVEKALEAISKIVKGKRDDVVLELSQDKIVGIRKVFRISNAEIEAMTDGKTLERALIDLVIERIALLATER